MHVISFVHTPRFVLSTDKRLMRLKPFAQSPVCWFRIPYAHIILVSSTDHLTCAKCIN